MNYIVLDLEWNQGEEKAKKHRELPFEIVEIGAVKLDKNKKIIGEFHQLIKPKVYSDMSHIVEKIIHLHMTELKKGKSFPKTMEEFFKWCGEEEYIFCTWGPMDLIELQRNMKFYNMQPLALGPFAYLDVQKLFSWQYEDKKIRRTLEYAVDFLHIEKNNSFHRAFSDAYYTAKILETLTDKTEKNISFDVYHIPKDKKQEIHIVFEDYAKYISRGFKTKVLALSDKEVASTRCYKCQRILRKKQKWFTPNSKNYYSVSYCPEHGYMKGKIRIRKTESGIVYAIKTQKFITEEEKNEIIKRKEKMIQQKKFNEKIL